MFALLKIKKLVFSFKLKFQKFKLSSVENFFLKKYLYTGFYKFYLFYIDNNIPVGQVRIDKSNGEVIIGISIDKDFRGKSLGVDMLKLACDNYFELHPNAIIIAYIKEENISSYNIFNKAGFDNDEKVVEHGFKSYKLYKRKS